MNDTLTMNTKQSIKRNDFVALNVSTKARYGTVFYPVGTKCRVSKAQRNGLLSVSPEGQYGGTMHLSKEHVTKIESPKANVKVGDIFVSAGGYEQTNVTFYRIVAVTNASVEIVVIGGNRKYTGPMCGETVPILNDVGIDRKTVRIRVDGDGTVSFKGIWGSTFPWNGQPCFFSEWH